MRLGGKPFRPLAACGLTAAALFAWGATAHAQTNGGGPAGSGMGSGSPAAGGSPGMIPGGPGMTGNPSFPGGNTFPGSNAGNFPGGGTFGGSSGATIGGPGGAGTLGSTAPYGGGGSGSAGSGGGSGSAGSGGGSGAIVALTHYATLANPPSAAPLIPARLSPDLQDLLSRSDGISAETRRGLTVAYDAGGTLVLRGTVASPAEGHAVESLIRFAPGVTGVRNEMTLAGPGRYRARD